MFFVGQFMHLWCCLCLMRLDSRIWNTKNTLQTIIRTRVKWINGRTHEKMGGGGKKNFTWKRHHILAQNLKTLSLWVLSFICCSTFFFPSNAASHYVPPQAKASSCRCHLHHWNMPFDHHYWKDFQHNEPVKPFVEPSTPIPLLGHWGTCGIIHINSRAIILVRQATHFIQKP